MKNYFKFQELCITGTTLPISVATKLLLYHIIPMNTVREKLGISITASQKSGYRPVKWEKVKGRSGNSQHTFKGKGAVDWTCQDFINNKNKFLHHIINNTEYTRMAGYDGFIHCDYKPTLSGKREIYKSNAQSEWELVKTLS